MAARTLTGLTPNEAKLGNLRMPKGVTIKVVRDDDHPDQYQALAVLVWLYRRREDPKAELEPLLDATVDDLMAELGADDDDDADDPTAPTT